MDSRTLEKINNLAKSLKENRLANDMQEAVAMAKGMLTKDPAGNPLTPKMISEMGHALDDDKKELTELEGESKALKADAEVTKEREEKASSQAHEHQTEFENLSKDVHDTKEEVHALKDAKEDSKEALRKEKEAYASEEAAEKDLPGEH